MAENPVDLTFSASSHEAIQLVIAPLVEQIYEQLGYSIEILTLPEERSLRLLENGDIDGDIVRTLEVTRKNSSFIPIWELGIAELVMVCQPELKCDKTALQQRNKILGSIEGNTYFHDILAGTTIRQVEFNTYPQLTKAFHLKRVDYYFDVINHALGERSKLQGLTSVQLQQFRGFHILSKKHQDKIPEIRQAFKQYWDEMLQQKIQQRLATSGTADD